MSKYFENEVKGDGTSTGDALAASFVHQVGGVGAGIPVAGTGFVSDPGSGADCGFCVDGDGDTGVGSARSGPTYPSNMGDRESGKGIFNRPASPTPKE